MAKGETRVVGLSARLEREGLGAAMMGREPARLRRLGLDTLSALVMHMLRSDPGRGRNLRWMAESYARGGYLLEDMPRVRAALSEHARVFPALPPEQRDIGRFRTLHDLERAMEPWAESEVLSSAEEERRLRESVMGETELLPVPPPAEQGGPSVLYMAVPLTHRAARWWGRGTKWCTSGRDEDAADTFRDYSREGPLLVIVLSDGRKFQAHLSPKGGVQFMDARDEGADPRELEEAGLSPFIAGLARTRNPGFLNFLTREALLDFGADAAVEAWPTCAGRLSPGDASDEVLCRVVVGASWAADELSRAASDPQAVLRAMARGNPPILRERMNSRSREETIQALGWSREEWRDAAISDPLLLLRLPPEFIDPGMVDDVVLGNPRAGAPVAFVMGRPIPGLTPGQAAEAMQGWSGVEGNRAVHMAGISPNAGPDKRTSDFVAALLASNPELDGDPDFVAALPAGLFPHLALPERTRTALSERAVCLLPQMLTDPGKYGLPRTFPPRLLSRVLGYQAGPSSILSGHFSGNLDVPPEILLDALRASPLWFLKLPDRERTGERLLSVLSKRGGLGLNDEEARRLLGSLSAPPDEETWRGLSRAGLSPSVFPREFLPGAWETWLRNGRGNLAAVPISLRTREVCAAALEGWDTDTGSRVWFDLPPALQRDQAFIDEAARSRPILVRSMPDAWKSREVVLLALERGEAGPQDVPPGMMDLELALSAVRARAGGLRELHDEWKRRAEVVEAALEAHPSTYPDVPPDILGEERAAEFVRRLPDKRLSLDPSLLGPIVLAAVLEVEEDPDTSDFPFEVARDHPRLPFRTGLEAARAALSAPAPGASMTP